MRNLVIAGFLALQIGLPVSYYLGSTPHDERFAWRMFSPVRLVTCEAELYDATSGSLQAIDPYREMHVVWLNLMKRGRLAVVKAYARLWCKEQADAGRNSPDLRAKLSCGVPDERALGICRRRPTDADRDGIPDAYQETLECDDPATCFKRDCGDTAADACYATRCRVVMLEGTGNLCQGDFR